MMHNSASAGRCFRNRPGSRGHRDPSPWACLLTVLSSFDLSLIHMNTGTETSLQPMDLQGLYLYLVLQECICLHITSEHIPKPTPWRQQVTPAQVSILHSAVFSGSISTAWQPLRWSRPRRPGPNADGKSGMVTSVGCLDLPHASCASVRPSAFIPRGLQWACSLGTACLS